MVRAYRRFYKCQGYLAKSVPQKASQKKDYTSKSFVLSAEGQILLLVDEYDKPVNDCLKYKKHESFCKNNVLEELKDKLYKYFKDIPCITLVTGINKLSMASFFSDFNNLIDYSGIVNL